MSDDDLHERMEQLEARIEEFSEIIESCRKYILLAKILVSVGGIVIVAMVARYLRVEPETTMLGLGAVIGGTVLWGANLSTRRGVRAAMAAAEAMRVRMIDSANIPSTSGVAQDRGNRLPFNGRTPDG